LFISYALSSQEKSAPELPRFSIRVNVGIPKVVSSKAFRNSFSGVITGDASVNCKLFSDFFVGVGYSYTYYKSQKYFRDKNVNTNMQAQNGYIKLGYDKFFNATSFVTISLNAGYNFNQYKGIAYTSDTLRGRNPTQFTSAFVEPMIGIYKIVDPNFAIGAHLSYNYNFSPFNPSYPVFDKWLNYNNLSNKWNMSMITLGFGFYYGLAKK
jgi:hypothetical protein